MTFYLHREPGNPSNGPTDIAERPAHHHRNQGRLSRTGKVLFSKPLLMPLLTTRSKEERLLNEMCLGDPKARGDADIKLEAESRRRIDQHWDAVEALAKALLAKPLTLRPPEIRKNGGRLTATKDGWMAPKSPPSCRRFN